MLKLIKPLTPPILLLLGGAGGAACVFALLKNAEGKPERFRHQEFSAKRLHPILQTFSAPRFPVAPDYRRRASSLATSAANIENAR